MRILAGLIAAATILWGGYWFVASNAVESGLRGWIDERRADGWAADYADLDTAGFPNRFDTTITALRLADTRSGLAWSAPFFKIFALSYKPHHIIAVWPNEQTLSTPLQRIAITSADMRASVVFQPGTRLALDRSSFDLTDFGLSSDLGWSAHLRHGAFHTRQSDGVENGYDVYFEATGVTPSRGLRRRLDPAGLLPEVYDSLRIDMSLVFDAPWDRFAIERRRPQPKLLELKELQANWGKLDLRLAGTLRIDERGIPRGQLSIKAQNWREMLQMAIDAGILPSEAAGPVHNVLQALAAMSGRPDTLDAPLDFRGGQILFGPVSLGPAPRLVIR